MKKFFNPDWKVLRKLEPSLKQAWFYIWDKADAIGVYEHDEDYFSIDNGFSLQFEDLLKIPRTEKISASKILLVDYIEVNYVALKENYNPHKPAFRSLEKHNLSLNSSLNQACFKLEEEDKDEDEDEDEEKKEKKKKSLRKKITVETSISVQMEEVWKIYLQKNFDVSFMASARDRKILNEIAAKLLFQVNEKQKNKGIISTETDNEKIMNAWVFILNNRDKWSNFHQELKELSAINSQLITIITDSKNANSKSSRNQIDPMQLAAEAINLSRQSAQRRAHGTGEMPQD